MDPIFIVGCQRSGTTFLGSLLGADPGSIAIPEAQFVADFAPADENEIVNFDRVIDRIEGHYRYGIWNFDLAGARPGGSGRYADAIRWLVRAYGERHGRSDPRRWIDHQPGHVREMERLRRHFPDLKVVHIVRDGRAVAASVMPLAWGPNAVLSAANYWSQRVAMGLALRGFLGEDRYVQLRYEDLVADPEVELRRLCEALSLDYHPSMIEGGGFAVPAFTKNQHALVGGRPVQARAQSWRKDLSPREIEMFEALVGPLLQYLGYLLDYGPEAKLPKFTEKVSMTLSDQLGNFANARKFNQRVKKFTRR